MSAMPETTPVASAEPAPPTGVKRSSLLSKIRLLLAIVATVTFLPYAWGYTLVLYSRWGRFDKWYFTQLIAGMLIVMVLNFHLSSKFASKRVAIWVGTAVFAVWTGIAAALIVLRNGDVLPHWLVFAGFYPATLWVVWAAWMFFAPIRQSVRFGVLGVLILAVVPFLYFFVASDLTGDTRVNFALRRDIRPDSDVKSTVGELSGDGISLVANDKVDYPAFQGLARTGVLPDAKLEHDWKSHPPRELWRVPVGPGWGGFAIVGKYSFTQEKRGEDECVVCRDVATGKELWVHTDAAPYKNKPGYEGQGGPGPRCTPTVYEGRVYTVGATGILNCLDGRTGHPIWTRNMIEENGGKLAYHGICGSPLIVGNLVVVAPTSKPESSLAAYDRLTGKPVWTGGRDSTTGDEASYASPMLATVDDVEQILNYTAQGVTAHDPNNGAVLWHYDWTNTEKVVCSQPIANAGAPDQVLVTVGYGKGSVLLKVTHGKDGGWSASPIWEKRQMKTKFTTAVMREGYVYGLDDGIMQCIDLKTGNPKWKRGRYEHGQILLAGDVIVVQTESPGNVVLVEASPEGLVELGSIPALSSKTWNIPALAGKYLLVRNDREAACYEVSLSSGESTRKEPGPAVH